jgi:hypothetical protein
VAYVVSLTGYTPVPRYDATPWTEARIEESTVSASGPWSTLDTQTLSPVDADPADPIARNFTVSTATPTGWYRVVWIDAGGDISESPAFYADQSSYQASGVQFSDLVSRLRVMSPMTEPEAKARLNQVHKRMVVDAEALTQSIPIAETVADQSVYELDPDIAQLLNVRIDGKRYVRKSVDEIEDLEASEAYSRGFPQRYFAPEFSGAGAGELRVYPTPTSAGLAITARAVMLPPDLVNDTDYPSLPSDFHEDLVDGAMATVLMRDDERLSDAFALEQRFERRIKELRGRMTRRVGSGPARIKLTR